ncbi:hypothetical protein SPBR_05788 [Sporothrix brasiliensis 5110]|uniref:Uncharacterized protein n=1 Tax=Sporothrix brasiliensis 5110 TaxID=1398154 RepID=A0A0C2F5U1_9PEZI|nr:uncharacterized protein SPBR_05788 [Sporothrix brasiliensis 5110]KIH94274.1 hypothetical protein SPBR_05788 [Sporothrix brasiliensis 5110]
MDDLDIEMEDAAGQFQNDAPPEVLPQEDILAIDADDAHNQEPGEINEASATTAADAAAAAADATTLIPTKVHIRGLDALNPDDIKAYVAEHYTGNGGSKGPFERIEWIDDTSANLLFSSEAAAATALAALSGVQIDDVSQLPLGELLPAKTYSAKPDDVSGGLSVRFALASDKKQSGAALRSRFYLLHPEYDPEERRRNQQYNRRRDGGRSDRSHRSYRDDRQDDRENDIRNNSFDVNLYDDDEPSRRARRRSRSYDSRTRRRTPRSWSHSRSRSRRSNNRDKELFPVGGNARGKELFPEKLGVGSDDRGRDRGRGRERGRERGRLRDRSASPRRDDGGGFYYDEADADDDDYDGRLADERAEADSAAAARNRDKARSIKDRLSTSKGDNSNGNGSGNSSRELFPGESRSSAHMDRFDDTSAVTNRLSGMSVFSSDGACHGDERSRRNGDSDGDRDSDSIAALVVLHSTRPNEADKDRITRPSDASSSSTFNIRGLAGSNNQQGISIKGVASARELFPNKLSSGNGNGNGGGGRGRNSGKEVFDNSLASRIQRPRQRAEDMFH